MFCCFNNSYKITPDIFDVWMRLLGAVDGSVLWLLDANVRASENLRREAENRGIAADRLVFAPRLAALEPIWRATVSPISSSTRSIATRTRPRATRCGLGCRC